MRSRCSYFLIIALMLFASCSGKHSKYVIGVSQCSEDIWRDKLNNELRVGTYFNDDIELKFASADDSDQKQIEQITNFIQDNVDLLIVSPNQVATISPVIDKAYDKGIPVIVFDRKTNTHKFSAFIGADNREMGRQIGHFIANRLHGKGKVVEITGLKDSSPAMERHQGFAEAMEQYPGITVVATLHGDWTQKSGQRVMNEFKKSHPDEYRNINYVFGQNDRMAMGAYESGDIKNHARFCGIDALPTKGGGIELVRDGILDASYIYPTHGDEVLQLAINILKNKPYKKENLLKAALVTKDNANVLLMQQDELNRQGDYLKTLQQKVSTYLARYNTQNMILILTITLIVMLIIAFALGFRYYVERLRIKDEREKMNEAQLDFFTNVSHEVRTPLSLIADPIARIVERGHLEEEDFKTLTAMHRNATQLMNLVGNILDFKKIKFDKTGNIYQEDSMISDDKVPIINEEDDIEAEYMDDRTTILVVDDNADIRNYLRYVLKDKFQVINAADGQEGLKLAQERIPDLIITDIMMPVMNGLQLCSFIKTDVTTSHIPVILLTAKSEDEQIAEGYEYGADSYITKPFNTKVLLARIDNIFKAKERIHKLLTSKAMTAETEKDKDDVVEYNTQKEEPIINIRDKEFIDKLHDIIMQNLSDSDFSVEAIGKEIGFSRVQLYRKVKALTGTSPVELIRKTRLDKARQLLMDGTLNISEVAYRTGFTSPSYFSKCFKSEFGQQPGAVGK